MSERVKIFRFWTEYNSPGNDASENLLAQKIEQAINSWLDKCGDKIKIIDIRCASGYKFQTMVIIVYELLEPKTKSTPPPPITLPNREKTEQPPYIPPCGDDHWMHK